MELMPAESFLAGMKPSCYENISRVPPDVMKKLERFPRFSVFPGYNLFFRDEQSRDKFAGAVAGLPRDSADFHRVLGLALGYPPLAVKFYEKKVSGEISREEFLEQKVGLYHAGIWCAGHKRDIVENIQWLWSQYPHDDMSRVTTYYNDGRQTYPARYGDFDTLHSIAEALNKTPTATV